VKNWLPYLLVLLFTAMQVKSQTDTAFWFGAPDLNGVIASGPNADRPIYLRVSTSVSPAAIRISQPANPNFIPIVDNIPANTSKSYDLTNFINSIENDLVNTVMKKGLLISANVPVSCYYDIVDNYTRPDGTIRRANGSIYSLKGNNALGKKFVVPFQMSFTNRRGVGPNYNEDRDNKNDFVIVATEDNTEVLIKAKNDLVGIPAGTAYPPVMLNKGETFMCRSNSIIPSQRPGGTVVTSSKPISISVNEDLLQYPGAGCADAAGDQLIPDELAGNEFIVVKGRFTGTNPDYFFVFATTNNTSIRINGALVATINAGEYYEWKLSDESCFVETSSPVHIYHVAGFGCEVSASVIPSIKCTGSTRVNITRASAAEEFYINIIAPKEIISDFIINNDPTQLPAGLFIPVKGNSKWMQARFSIAASFAGTDANITIENISGKFHAGVIQGGSSSTSRYGYFSDFSTNTIFLKDPKNPNTQLKDEKIFCYKEMAGIQVINSEKDVQFRWTGPNGFSADTSFLGFSSFLPRDTGVYTITTTSPGCGSSSKTIKLKIDKPRAGFDFTTNGCMEDSVRLTVDGNAGVRWKWDMGNGVKIDTNKADLKAFKFSTGGDFTIALKVESALGCFSDDSTRTIRLSTKPIPKYSIQQITCINDDIVFKDESNIASGTIQKWKWNLDDGSGWIEVNNNADKSTKYNQWGAKKVRLVNVSHTGCISDTFQLSTFKVNPLPKPGFIIPEVCLDDATAKFIDTTLSPDGFNQFSYQWKFNTGSNPVSPGPIFTSAQTTEKEPAVRYMSTGRYQVQLIVNSRGCIDSITQSFKVNGTNPVPAFEVLQSQSFCSNDSVKIVNQSTIDFDNVTRLEILWDQNDPSLKTIDEEPLMGKKYAVRYPSFQFPLQKTIRITLRAFSGNAFSCSKTITKEITLFASPKTNFNPLPSICLNSSARQIIEAGFDARVPGNFLYTGNGVTNAGVFDPSKAGVGDHTIQYTYTSSNTGCKDSASQKITVWPLPDANFNLGNILCEKNKTFFSSVSTANGGQITQLIWDYGDGSKQDSLTIASADHIYDKWGAYSVALKVKNSNGCFSDIKIKQAQIYPLPIVAFDLPKVCLPEAKAVFLNKSSIADGTDNFLTYKWDFNDPMNNTSSVNKNGDHMYTKTGPFNVKLMVTSRNNCIDSLTKTFSDIFPQPRSFFQSEDSLCLGQLLRLQDSSVVLNGWMEESFWTLGDNNSSTGKMFTHQYKNSGSFIVTHYIRSTLGCYSDTTRKIVNVFDYPKVSAGPDLNVLDDGQKKIFATATGTILSYKWTPALYLSHADSLQPFIIKPQEDQTYLLTVRGRGDCISYDEMKMKVVRLPKPPNTFTPNGDGINDTWKIQYLDQYPDCMVEIYTTSGQMVYKSTGYPKEWDGRNNGKELPAGTYYYIIDPKNGRKRMAGYVQILK
jgi:gliding motility-associated-like protein